MTDRKALAAALAELERWMKRREVGAAPPLTMVLAAARERLAQLPEKCETCSLENGGNGAGWVAGRAPVGKPCPTCHGSGKVYPAELVERVAKVLMDEGPVDFPQYAVAVLDALHGTADG